MGLVASYPMQGMQPSRNRDFATRGGVALPWGGPTDVGGEYPQGAALTLVGGPAQPAILTLTVSGTGTYRLQFINGGAIVQSLPLAQNATAAQVCTALQAIWPAWVLPTGSVTGSAGGPYTVTFGQNTGIGGAFQSITVSGSAAVAVVRTQRGSVGAGQYEYTNGTTYTTAAAFLVDAFASSPTGTLVARSVPYPTPDDTTSVPWAWIEGFFYAADSPNLTTAIVNASSPKLSFYLGSATTDGGAQVRLLQ